MKQNHLELSWHVIMFIIHTEYCNTALTANSVLLHSCIPPSTIYYNEWTWIIAGRGNKVHTVYIQPWSLVFHLNCMAELGYTTEWLSVVTVWLPSNYSYCGLLHHCIPIASSLQKQIGCFTHRVVTLVADKLKIQWLCTIYDIRQLERKLPRLSYKPASCS